MTTYVYRGIAGLDPRYRYRVDTAASGDHPATMTRLDPRTTIDPVQRPHPDGKLGDFLCDTGTLYVKPLDWTGAAGASVGTWTGVTFAETTDPTPAGYIPRADLAADVVASLDAADTAYQLPETGVPLGDLAADVQATLDAVTAVDLSLAVDDATVDEGDEVTLTATASLPGIPAVTPTGTVTFTDGSTELGEGPVALTAGVAELAVTDLAHGARTVTATYSAADGSAWSAAVDTVAVQVAEETTTTLAADDTSVTVGTEVTLTATLDPLTAAGTVQFLDGVTAMGTPVALAAGVAEKATTTLTEGEHSITAVFIPTAATVHMASTSDPVVVTVSAA